MRLTEKVQREATTIADKGDDPFPHLRAKVCHFWLPLLYNRALNPKQMSSGSPSYGNGT
jgi:hypothetical protein